MTRQRYTAVLTLQDSEGNTIRQTVLTGVTTLSLETLFLRLRKYADNCQFWNTFLCHVEASDIGGREGYHHCLAAIKAFSEEEIQ